MNGKDTFSSVFRGVVRGAVLLGASSVLADQPLKIEHCHPAPWEAKSSQWNAGQDLPAFLSKTKIVASLCPMANYPPRYGKTGEEVIGIGAKPWRSIQNAYVLVVETDMRQLNTAGGSDSAGHRLYIALVLPSDNGIDFEIIAKTLEPISLKDFHFSNFDLAPYNFSKSEKGFGIRTCLINTGTQRMAVWERLNLFRLTGSDIVRVLETTMHEGDLNLRGKGEDKIQVATISVDSRQSNGYFNLIKRSKKKSALFRWDGQHYTTSDDDPLR